MILAVTHSSSESVKTVSTHLRQCTLCSLIYVFATVFYTNRRASAVDVWQLPECELTWYPSTFYHCGSIWLFISSNQHSKTYATFLHYVPIPVCAASRISNYSCEVPIHFSLFVAAGVSLKREL